MKKTIIVKQGQVVEMTFEEVLKKHKGMVMKEVRKHTMTSVFNAIEEEDLYQSLTVYVWNAFNDYEVERGVAFSTFLYNYLRDGKRRETHHLFAEKRSAEDGIYSIDEEAEKEGSFYDTYADSSLSVESTYDEKELMQLLKENLTEMEFDVLNILLCEVEGNRGDKKAFAQKWGFSRPTAYKKITEISNNLKDLVLDNGYFL